MSKSDWEKRVGMLLDSRTYPQFVYSYKPIDGMHGGQPKIDWHACDKAGRYWLIEVKWLPEDRTSINFMSEITAGQRDGLAAVASSWNGVALLAVGQGKTLYWFDWREVILWSLKMQHEHAMSEDSIRDRSLLLPLSDSFAQFQWTGPKTWKYLLTETVQDYLSENSDDATAPTPIRPAGQSPKQEPSRPILRRKGSTPIVPMMRPLEP